MDQTDREILALLAGNGRRSNVEIARELGISEGTVRKRIDRLLESGALTIRGVAEPELAGYRTRAIFFLTVELPELQEALALIGDMPEVLSISRVTGEYDLVLDAAFPSDEALATFLNYRLSQVPGIVSAKTAHVLEIVRHRHDWAVPDPETPRIMVVDDDPDFVEATRIVLEREGFAVSSAASGNEALIAMAVNPPDLVILDIMMDGVLDGWDASWRIRSNPRLRDLPILVVSSITATDYLSMVPTDADNLIDNFLSKPVAPGRLVEETRRLLRRSVRPERAGR